MPVILSKHAKFNIPNLLSSPSADHRSNGQKRFAYSNALIFITAFTFTFAFLGSNVVLSKQPLEPVFVKSPLVKLSLIESINIKPAEMPSIGSPNKLRAEFEPSAKDRILKNDEVEIDRDGSVRSGNLRNKIVTDEILNNENVKKGINQEDLVKEELAQEDPTKNPESNIADDLDEILEGSDEQFLALLKRVKQTHPDWLIEDLKTGQYVITQPFGQFAIVDSLAWIDSNADVPTDQLESDEYVQAFIESLFGRDPRLDLKKIEKSIKPIIRDESYFTHYRKWQRKNKRSTEIPFLFKIIAPELRVMYLVDYGEVKRVILKRHLEELGMELDQLHQLAIENLSEQVPMYSLEGSDRLMVLRANGTYEASFMLIEGFWHPAVLGFIETPIVYVPRPNILLITKKGDKEASLWARELLMDPTNDFLNILSIRGYELTDKGWTEIKLPKVVRRYSY